MHSIIYKVTAETLRAHVDAILMQPFDDQPPLSPPRLAPFITFYQLSNLREVVVNMTNADS